MYQIRLRFLKDLFYVFLILGLIGNILNLTDWVSPYLNGAIQGVIIVLAVILQREKRPDA